MEPTSIGSAPDLGQFQQAVVQDHQGRPQLQENIPVLELLPGTVLVRTRAVALNPVDYKMGAAYPRPGAVIGNDFAGTIVQVANRDYEEESNEAANASFKVGDHVFGAVSCFNANTPNDGAFAEYVRAPASLLLRLPEGQDSLQSINHYEAASFGTALATCSLALWYPGHLGLKGTPDSPLPKPASPSVLDPPPILVYGGSTATGTMALQLLRLSGYGANLVAICSPHNFALARSYGAAHVFDYGDCRAEVLGAAIFAQTGGRLRAVLDCIGDAHSTTACLRSMARTGGRYVALEHVPDALLSARRVVHTSMVMAAEAFGDELRLSEDGAGPYDRSTSTEKRALAEKMFSMFQRLLVQGELRPHPIEVLNLHGKPGLQVVAHGLQRLKDGEASGKKFVALV